jgi:cholesterol transport system auxiliary component
MTTRPTLRPLLTLAAAGVAALALSGCISVLPKSNPAQLYRLAGAPAAASAPAPAAAPAATVGVYLGNGQFQRESAADRILTVTGERAAYIADARWIAPAEVLFDEAVVNAFEAAGGRVRLISRGEPARSDYALRLDVRNFETDYGAGGAPVVLIRVRAVITRDQTRGPVAEQLFEARVPASQNRVGAIVSAYDQALGKVLGDVVGWANGAVS